MERLPPAALPLDDAAAAKPRVLIVEDEPLLLEVISADLEEAGFAVAQEASGEDALARLQGREPFDILFTDIGLPGPMDGWRLAEAALLLRPALAIIYATGFTQFAACAARGKLFVPKPYRARTVIQAMRGLNAAG